MLWLSLTLETTAPLTFHPQECGFKGGMWHGMIESVLRSQAAALRPALFDGPAHQRARLALFPPLDTVDHYPAGERLKCALILYGEACAHWHPVAQALLRPDALRLGSQRIPLRVSRIDALHPQQLASPLYRIGGGLAAHRVRQIDAPSHHARGANSLTLGMLTPVTICTQARRDLGLEAEPPTLARWVKALRQRLCELEPALAQQFGFDGVAWQTQEHALRAVRIADAAITLKHWTYGSRTKMRPIALSGQVGQIRFAGDIAPAVLSLLDLGQWLGVGQRTTMGQGWYRLE